MSAHGGWRHKAAWFARQWLDRLPWLWGERCCAVLFVVRMVVRPSRLSRALAWAEAHARPSQGRWRLALGLAAAQGRFRARHWLLGLRSPEALLRHTRFVGEEQLPQSGGLLLLGFHVGATAVGAALKAGGHARILFEGERDSRSWSNAAWADVRRAAHGFALDEDRAALGPALYSSHRQLLEGARIFMTADGGSGRVAFTLPLRGGPDHIVRAGWLALRRSARVPVMPVTSHVEGHVQVITFHAPLPEPASDRTADVVVCRMQLGALIDDFVARYPEQCSGLLFDV